MLLFVHHAMCALGILPDGVLSPPQMWVVEYLKDGDTVQSPKKKKGINLLCHNMCSPSQ